MPYPSPSPGSFNPLMGFPEPIQTALFASKMAQENPLAYQNYQRNQSRGEAPGQIINPYEFDLLKQKDLQQQDRTELMRQLMPLLLSRVAMQPGGSSMSSSSFGAGGGFGGGMNFPSVAIGGGAVAAPPSGATFTGGYAPVTPIDYGGGFNRWIPIDRRPNFV